MDDRKTGKRVMICPLDWGLGHATRCVPIINRLINKGLDVYIAADNKPLAFLKREFPDCKFVKFPGYQVSYSANGNMLIKMLQETPNIIKSIKNEHNFLETLVQKHNIDAVISDNRFGAYSKKAFSVFITHQLMVKAPQRLSILEPIIHKLNLSYIKKFNLCWIPDKPDAFSNLSGDLSHHYKKPKNAEFIGFLSRFKNAFSAENETKTNYKYDVCGIISGPEPQRKMLEDILKQQLKQTKYNCVIFRGLSEEVLHENEQNIEMFSHLPSREMRPYIENSQLIICRSGYSSLMDLAVLGKNALLIPTPGQTEQEYLAKLCLRRNYFLYKNQNMLDLSEDIEHAMFFDGVSIFKDVDLLQEKIDYLCNQI